MYAFAASYLLPLLFAIIPEVQYPPSSGREVFAVNHDLIAVDTCVTVRTDNQSVVIGVFTTVFAIDDAVVMQKVEVVHFTEVALALGSPIDLLINQLASHHDLFLISSTM